MTSRHPIDFKLIADAALSSARRLLKDWLPGGNWSGDEYKPRNPTRDDRHPGSFVINARTGQWIDNATSDSGGDLISLYAYIKLHRSSSVMMPSSKIFLTRSAITDAGQMFDTSLYSFIHPFRK